MNGLWMLQSAAEQLAVAREGLDTPLGSRLTGLVGLATMIGIAWVLSNNRRRISWRLVALGVALQAAFGVVVLKTGVGRAVFAGASGVFRQLLGFTEQGAVRFRQPGTEQRSGRHAAWPAVGHGTDRRAGCLGGDWCVLRVQRAADHHLLFHAVRDPLLHGRNAVDRERDRVGHAAHHGDVGCRDPLGCGEHLRWAN